MRTIVTRLDRLEQQRGTQDQRRAQIEADAAMVWAKIDDLAAAMEQGGRVPEPQARERWAEWSTGFLAGAS